MTKHEKTLKTRTTRKTWETKHEKYTSKKHDKAWRTKTWKKQEQQ